MQYTTKRIRQIGTSKGVILPKEYLENINENDTLQVVMAFNKVMLLFPEDLDIEFIRKEVDALFQMVKYKKSV